MNKLTEPVMTREEVISHAINPCLELRDRALFTILYLSNSRVGEVVRRLKNDQIVYATHKHKRFLVFNNLYTEKNREHPWRNIPVRIDKEKELINVLLEYSRTLPEQAILFDFSRQHAWRIIKKVSGKYCHWLRHTRNTHYLTYYKLRPIILKNLNGWSDFKPLKYYAHLDWRDAADQM